MAGIIFLFIAERARAAEAAPLVQQLAQRLDEIVTHQFLVHSCARCQEQEMLLVEFSPNGRSVHYECLHCHKRMRALAGSPAAASAVIVHANLLEFGPRAVKFNVVATPLPYEQTKREPIPEAVRSEVWRRDQGRCVKCRAKQQLEFDHIIPVSRGGATTVRNLQLLCRPCNASKAATI